MSWGAVVCKAKCHQDWLPLSCKHTVVSSSVLVLVLCYGQRLGMVKVAGGA